RGAAAARLLWDRGVVALAVDNPTVEPQPTRNAAGQATLEDLCHTNVMVALGIILGEFFDFGPLSEACRADGRYEFLFTSSPLWVPGGVGSPPNALAIR